MMKKIARKKNTTKAIAEHSGQSEPAALTPVKKSKRSHREKKPLSKLSKILIGAGSVIGLFAVAAIIMVIISGGSGKVKVFSLSEISMTEAMMGTGNESQGMISAENLQTVFVSESQQVKAIYVKEGDYVKKGDRLMSYDTTLDVLEVDKKALEVTQQKLQLANLKKQLSEVNTYRPSVPTTAPTTPTLPPDVVAGETVTDCQLIAGTGTQGDPFIYVIAGDSIPCDSTFIASLFANANGATDVWAVYQRRASNTTGGTVKEAWGVKYTDNLGSPSFKFFDASHYIYTIPEPEIPADTGSGFTAAEIASMKADLIKQINELDLEIRIAEVEVKQMRLEIASGDVLAEIDGTVVSVNPPSSQEVSSSDGFYYEPEPVIKVSGGGGFYVEGTISELQLDKISIGDAVTVMSWESGMSYEGTITEIINLPTEYRNYGG
ncbi:MAG: hypothetical protein E7559_09805, partial [Ruminococcaceae bacterium]|nr:hypothetical protein [Oscillospiraceae bacterium]